MEQKIQQNTFGFEISALKTDPCIYVRNEENEEKFYIVLYVDDFLLICKNRESLNLVKNQLSSKYDLHDLGPVEQFLNMVITRNRKNRTIHLSQIMQIQNVLELTSKENCVPVHHPFCSSLVLNVKDCSYSANYINLQSFVL